MQRINKLSRVCACVLLAGCGGGSGTQTTARTTRYVITDLGSNFSSSQAYGLNNLGQVVGSGTTRYIGGVQPDSPVLPGQTQTTSFLYANEKVASLGSGAAYSINDSGQIVVAGGVYQNNALTPVPSLTPPDNTGFTSFANVTAINNQGHIVGSATTDPRAQTFANTHAVLYADGRLTDLGTLNGSFSRAEAINDQGQIVGTSVISSIENGGSPGNATRDTVTPTFHAFLWQSGKISDLGALEEGSSEAAGINDNGQIVGASTRPDNSTHAVLWQNGGMQDLGISGAARAINNSGQIVGIMSKDGKPVVGVVGLYPGTSVPPNIHAFVYQKGQAADLNTLLPANSGWELTDARAINNKGQICGVGNYQGATHAFLLTPQ